MEEYVRTLRTPTYQEDDPPGHYLRGWGTSADCVSEEDEEYDVLYTHTKGDFSLLTQVRAPPPGVRVRKRRSLLGSIITTIYY